MHVGGKLVKPQNSIWTLKVLIYFDGVFSLINTLMFQKDVFKKIIHINKTYKILIINTLFL